MVDPKDIDPKSVDPKDTGSAMDDPSVAADPDAAIDYANAAGDIITDLPVAGPGDMPIGNKLEAFRGFMSISRYGGTAIVLIVFWSTLIFGLDASPFWTMVSTLGLGLLCGAALKLRGAYYPILVVACLVLWLIGGIASDWIAADVPEVEEIVVTEDGQ